MRSGRVLPEFPDSGFRDIIASEYRIIYRVNPDVAEVEIIVARHGAQVEAELLDPRPGPGVIRR